MLTKNQKAAKIDASKAMLKSMKTLVFVDFTGTSVEGLKKLRRGLNEIGAKMEVVKKKLLRVAFSESNINFNPEQFDMQVATIFSDKDISEVAGVVYRFSKEVEKTTGFKILGAYDLTASVFSDAEIIKTIGKLPSREILIAQFLGMLTVPLKKLLVVLDETSKK